MVVHVCVCDLNQTAGNIDNIDYIEILKSRLYGLVKSRDLIIQCKYFYNIRHEI